MASKNILRGFTLLELLIVIAIIGILASIVFASLNASRDKSKNAAILSQSDEYKKAMELYFSEYGVYPPSTTWDCLGSGYVGGVCWSGGASYTENPAFITALSQFIPNMPAFGANLGKTPSASIIVGALYNRLTPTRYTMVISLQGHNQNCGKPADATYPRNVGTGDNAVTDCRWTIGN